jgi:hypothetical protein
MAFQKGGETRMNWSIATDTELLTVIFHETGIPLSWIMEAAEEYRRRHPGNTLKWYRYEGKEAG